MRVEEVDDKVVPLGGGRAEPVGHGYGLAVVTVVVTAVMANMMAVPVLRGQIGQADGEVCQGAVADGLPAVLPVALVAPAQILPVEGDQAHEEGAEDDGEAAEVVAGAVAVVVVQVAWN